MKYLYIIIIAVFFISHSSAQFDVKLNVDNVNKRLKVLVRNTVSNAPTTSQNISSINMKLLGPKVDNIISIHAGNYTIQMPNPDKIITMSSVSLPSPKNWMQNQWVNVVTYNLTPGMEYTSAVDFTVQPDIDMDNSDVDDPIMSVQAAGLFNIPLNILSTTLPVRLISFEAIQDNGSVVCQWITESEINNAGFEIQHSINGYDFDKIGWEKSRSNSNKETHYQFIDTPPNTGHNYYRLKQMDRDGKHWYSDVASVYINKDKDDITLFPNPVSDKLFVNGLDEEDIISVYSSNGELINKYAYGTKGIDVRNLVPGVYFLSIQSGNGQSIKRFVVN